jgi:4'-phosphopantetheinyl transferase
MTAKIDVLFLNYEKERFLSCYAKLLKELPQNFVYEPFARDELALPTLAARLMVLDYLRGKGLPDQPWQKYPHGKPQTQSGLHFNISHSQQNVVVAFHNSDIGIDIEVVRKVNHPSFKRVFGHEELSYIGRSDERFFELWTRKEALIKADGRGFSLPVNQINSLETPVEINQKLWHWQAINFNTSSVVSHIACQDRLAQVEVKNYELPY